VPTATPSPTPAVTPVVTPAITPAPTTAPAEDFVIDEDGILRRYTGKGGAVIVPAGITGIADYAFESCGVTGVELPDGVTRIGEFAFANCASLSRILIPDSVTSIAGFAFYGCSEEMIIRSSLNACAKDWAADYGFAWEHDRHTQAILAAVKATCTQTGLTEGVYCSGCGEILIAQEILPLAGHPIRMESDVYEMQAGMQSCPIIASTICGHAVGVTAYLPPELTLISQEDSSVVVAANTPGTATLRFETDDEFQSSASCTLVIHAQQQMILPAALTTIKEESFANLSAEEIVLGSNVETIGARAFADCKNLVLINLPDDVQIAEGAFSGCNQLTILCTGGSTGHAYAIEQGIPYIILTSSAEAE